jgi:hypothetical protein
MSSSYSAYGFGSDLGGGEANTASNVGTGSGIFLQKVDADLQFKSIASGQHMNISSTPDGTLILNAEVGKAEIIKYSLIFG